VYSASQVLSSSGNNPAKTINDMQKAPEAIKVGFMEVFWWNGEFKFVSKNLLIV